MKKKNKKKNEKKSYLKMVLLSLGYVIFLFFLLWYFFNDDKVVLGNNNIVFKESNKIYEYTVDDVDEVENLTVGRGINRYSKVVFKMKDGTIYTVEAQKDFDYEFAKKYCSKSVSLEEERAVYKRPLYLKFYHSFPYILIALGYGFVVAYSFFMTRKHTNCYQKERR